MKRTILLALVAGSVLPAAPAHAAETNSMLVSYADLNLASGVGRTVLQRRIGYAARVVCVIEDSRELALRSATNDCRGDAITRAQPAYDAAVAAAVHPSVTVIGAAAALTVTSR